MTASSETDRAPKPLDALIEEARLQALDLYRTLPSVGLDGLARVSQEAARSLGATQAAVSFVDRTRVWYGGAFGFEMGAVARANSFCDVVVRSAAPLVVTDAVSEARFSNHELIWGSQGIRSYAGVPLINDGGYTLGSIGVYSVTRDRFSAAILPNLSALAALVRDFLTETCRSEAVRPDAAPRKPVQGWLGVKVLEPKGGEAVGSGLVVIGVKPGSPAADCGVRTADIIYWIGETELAASSDIAAAMAGRDAGSRVPIKLRRAGQWLECEVEIKARRRSLRPR